MDATPEFSRALAGEGFHREEQRGLSRSSGAVYVASPNRFATYTVQIFGDGSALFSWEFAIADYVATLGMQVGSDEGLNQYLFPRQDVRGPQDPAWLTAALDGAAAMLASVRPDQIGPEQP